MKRINHLAITASCGIMLGCGPVGLAGILTGAVLPDTDIKLGVPHRTWTHWWALYATGFGLLYFFPFLNPIETTFLKWIFVGALFHILEDSVTVGGVPLYAPVSLSSKSFGMRGSLFPNLAERFTFGITKTGGVFEYVVMIACIIILVRFFPDKLNAFLGDQLSKTIASFKHIGGF